MNKILLFLLLQTLIIYPKLQAQTFINENFNAGIPLSWSVSVPTCYNLNDTTKWSATSNGFRSQGLSSFSLDGTEFVVVDSDKPNIFCTCNEYLTTPVFDATGTPSLTLEFDHYFRHYNGDFGYVEVFNGSTWVTCATFSTNIGYWMAPNHQTVSLTPYINANMQVRFHYQANWDYYWSLDNVLIYGGGAFVVSANANPDTVCSGQCTDLTASGATTYTWMPGNLTGTTVNVCPNSTTIYTVTGTLGGNTSSATVTVVVNQSPTVNLATFIDTCINVSPFTMFGGTPNGGVYSGTGVTGSIFDPSLAGAGTFLINYTFTDLNGCVASASQNVTVNPLPSIIASAEFDTVCLGFCTDLYALGANVYTWDPIGLTGSTVNDCPIATTIYTVTGVDINGCSNSDTVSVYVDPCVNVSNYSNHSSFNISPNPAYNKIMIRCEQPNIKDVTIFNLQGKQVLSIVYSTLQSASEIDISDLSKGIYIIKLYNESYIVNRKLVIQ